MKKTILTLLLSALCFSVIGFCATSTTDSIAEAADIYDLFTDEHIVFYETELAHRPVVSNIKQSVLEKRAREYNVGVDKFRKVLVVQHAFSQSGNEYTVEQILSMNTGDLLRGVRTYINWLKETTPPEDLAAIGEKFKSIKKTTPAQ